MRIHKKKNVELEPNVINRVSKTDYYLDIAEEVSERSTCLKRHYGAIIVKDDEIIATGYNGAPRGMSSCLDCEKCNRHNSKRGDDYNQCKAVHAEQNAIISASRREMIGSALYITGLNADGTYVENPAPCALCKRMIINAGIEKVYIRTGLTSFKTFLVDAWTTDDIIGGY